MDKELKHNLEIEFRKAFRKGPSGISWAPGRANLMGMHVDHTGGSINALALPRGVGVAFGRGGRRGYLDLRHRLSKFPGIRIPLAKITRPLGISWSSFAKIPPVCPGWAGYVECGLSAALDPGDKKRPGLRLLVDGDLPMGGGLSSSAALIIASFLSGAHLYGRRFTRSQMVLRAGQSELKMGAKIGFGDHSAILLSKTKHMAHVLPVTRKTIHVPWPDSLEVILVPSGIMVRKGMGARQRFNIGPEAYRLGLRNITDIQASASSEGWGGLSRSLTETQLRSLLKVLPQRVSSKGRSQVYLRGICLFGVSESLRAHAFPRLIQNRQGNNAGQLMNISQKADVYLRPPTADRLRKGRLALQPGWYGAGHPRLDRIHQKLRKIPGVLGSRTEGAGMGGTIVVLAKKAGGDEILRLFPKAWRVSPGPPASVLPK